MKREKLTLEELKNKLIDDLEFNKDKLANGDIDEIIEQMIDSILPVFTFDILEIAMDNFSLAVNVPELYAFDGEHSAVNAIVGNIYSRLKDVADDWVEKNLTNK